VLGGVPFVLADLAKPEERARLHGEAKRHLGHISILVTNADGPPTGKFTEKSLEDWRGAFEQSMLSAVDLALRVVPEMMAKGWGRIVNIGSISTKEPTRNTPLSNGVKTGLVGALATLAREVAGSGVTVNNILPGPFDTDLMWRVATALLDKPGMTKEDAMRGYLAHVPVGRLGTIEEFGALCAFLCSRKAGFITGQSIVIDGGLVGTIM